MKGQLWNAPPVPIMRKPFVPQGEINKKDKIPGKKKLSKCFQAKNSLFFTGQMVGGLSNIKPVFYI